jgi:FkbM family methyltransferase
MTRLKNIALRILFSDLVFKFTSSTRQLPILLAVRKLSHKKIFRMFADLYDPNFIRKRLDIEFQPRVVTVGLNVGQGKTVDFEVDVNDHIGWRIFLDGSFDETHLRIAKILQLSKDDVFLDIGANIGSVSIAISSATECEIIAIEANPRNSSQFLRNVALNPIRVNFWNCAVVDSITFEKHRFVEIHSNNGNQGASSIHENWNKPHSKSSNPPSFAPTALLDDLITPEQENRIKLVKIDIEGSEFQALQGFKKLFKMNAPIVFEYRIDLKINGSNSGVEKVPSLLSKHFCFYRVTSTRNGVTLSKFHADIPCDNVLGIPHLAHEDLFKKFEFAKI